MNFFGTDGIRGVANVHPLTPEFAMRIAVAAARVLSNNNKKLVVIGADTRRSSNMLSCASGAALMSMGFDVLNLDVIPTAGLSWITKKLGAAFGIMISASHNPYWDNGIKIFSGDGYKLSEETEMKIEKELFNEGPERPTHDKIGCSIRPNSFIVDPVSEYAEYVASLIERSQASGEKKKLKAVIDGANGAASYLVKRIFSDRFNAVSINCQPDGSNINFNCGSTHLESLAARVKEERANIGIAFDGDSDRALFVDEHGNIVDGDFIMAMLALDLKERGKLKNNLVVGTVMTNLGFIHAMKKLNIDFICTPVGDRNVLAEMVKNGGIIGGEQSGHIIMLEENHTGDGLITAVHILNLMKRTGRKLSELSKVMKKYPQILINVQVPGDKNAYKNNGNITLAITEAEERFKNRGRVLIRPSGTENIVRVMIEGEDKNEISESAEKIARVIRENSQETGLS